MSNTYFFFYLLISLNSILLYSRTTYIGRRLNWAFLMHVFAKYSNGGKMRLKITLFLINQVFARTLTTFGLLRCRIISVELSEFRGTRY